MCCEVCSDWVTYCHLCLTGFKGLCVCAQVSCTAVCNRSLCDLFVDVCIVIFCLQFLISSILFVLETPDDG
jgi:hypothetical protein